MARPRKNIRLTEEFFISTENKTNKKLTLTRTLPYIDECKNLIAKMVKQTFRDYCNLYHSTRLVDREIFQEAKDFIFDNTYVTNWGGKERNLQDFLDIIGVEIEWFRVKVEETRIGKKYRQKKSRESEYAKCIFEEESIRKDSK